MTPEEIDEALDLDAKTKIEVRRPDNYSGEGLELLRAFGYIRPGGRASVYVRPMFQVLCDTLETTDQEARGAWYWQSPYTSRQSAAQEARQQHCGRCDGMIYTTCPEHPDGYPGWLDGWHRHRIEEAAES